MENLDELYKKQQEITQAIAKHESGLVQLDNLGRSLYESVKEQREYMATLVESYNILLKSGNQVNDSVMILGERFADFQIRLNEIESNITDIVPKVADLENGGISSNEVQALIAEQSRIISVFNEANNKLISQMGLNQKEILGLTERNVKLMNQLNAKQNELLELTAAYNKEKSSISKKMTNIYVVLFLFVVALAALGAKVFGLI